MIEMRTLPNTLLNIPDFPRHIDRNQESWYFRNNFNYNILNLTNPKPWTNWQVFTSRKLNLIMNVTPIPNFIIQF